MPAKTNQLKVPGRKERQTVIVGLVQMAVSEDIKLNMKRAAEKIEEAAKNGAQIVCLPELYRTPYFPQEEKQDATQVAETIPGESTETFSSLAKKLGVAIIAPLFEEDKDGKHYNTAAVIDANGQNMGTYRKMHVPQDPCFYEKDYFEPGNRGYQVFKTAYADIGVLICYDQWFPEPARILSLKGAAILFYPTAIGWIKGHTSADGDWHDAWKTIQRGHAIANGVHVAAVNRVGKEGQLKFWGGSFVCNSFGTILKEAGRENEEVLVTKVDLGMNKRIREGWGFLKNRRPATYKLLTQNDA
jgi:agmatine deiminase